MPRITSTSPDTGNNRVVKLAPESGPQQVVGFSGLNSPFGVAVDLAGNIYAVDDGQRVVQFLVGRNIRNVLPFAGLSSIGGIAVDSAGNVYVVDTGNNQVLMLPAGSSTQQVLGFSDLHYPGDVAVDSDGNVYVSEIWTYRVRVVDAGSGHQHELSFDHDLYHIHVFAVAVDRAANVYVTDNFQGQGYWVAELAAGSRAPRLLPFTDLDGPNGVAGDAAGTVYVTDYGHSRLANLTSR